MSYTWESDDAVDKAARSGDQAALDERDRRQTTERERRAMFDAQRRSAPGPTGTGGSFIALLLLLAPIAALVFLLMGLMQGAGWLATESPLAPLFPGPAATTTEFLVAVGALLLLLPGLLWLGGVWLHGTRARPLAWLLLPLATVLVPVVLLVSAQTTALGPAGHGVSAWSFVLLPALLVVVVGMLAWQRSGFRGLVGLNRRVHRAERIGDVPRMLELQQRLVRKGLRTLGWQHPAMLEEVLVLAGTHRRLGRHDHAMHLTHLAFDAARSQSPQVQRELQDFARGLGL